MYSQNVPLAPLAVEVWILRAVIGASSIEPSNQRPSGVTDGTVVMAPVSPVPSKHNPTGAAGSVAASNGTQAGLFADPSFMFRCEVVSVPVTTAAAVLVLTATQTAAPAANATEKVAPAYHNTMFTFEPGGLNSVRTGVVADRPAWEVTPDWLQTPKTKPRSTASWYVPCDWEFDSAPSRFRRTPRL